LYNLFQPWVGLAGVVSTLLATFAAFGLLVLLGAEFTNFNYGAIFIMIGIGTCVLPFFLPV
jgi:hypothetical protein